MEGMYYGFFKLVIFNRVFLLRKIIGGFGDRGRIKDGDC